MQGLKSSLITNINQHLIMTDKYHNQQTDLISLSSGSCTRIQNPKCLAWSECWKWRVSQMKLTTISCWVDTWKRSFTFPILQSFVRTWNRSCSMLRMDTCPLSSTTKPNQTWGCSPTITLGSCTSPSVARAKKWKSFLGKKFLTCSWTMVGKWLALPVTTEPYQLAWQSLKGGANNCNQWMCLPGWSRMVLLWNDISWNCIARDFNECNPSTKQQSGNQECVLEFQLITNQLGPLQKRRSHCLWSSALQKQLVALGKKNGIMRLKLEPFRCHGIPVVFIYIWSLCPKVHHRITNELSVPVLV